MNCEKNHIQKGHSTYHEHFQKFHNRDNIRLDARKCNLHTTCLSLVTIKNILVNTEAEGTTHVAEIKQIARKNTECTKTRKRKDRINARRCTKAHNKYLSRRVERVDIYRSLTRVIRRVLMKYTNFEGKASHFSLPWEVPFPVIRCRESIIKIRCH